MKMKNISTYFTRTACALLLLAVSAGCEAFPTDDSGFTPETPELSIRANEVENVPREKTTLTIPVESNLPWACRHGCQLDLVRKGPRNR